ncbi:MAG: low molecular weight phosphatase family protein [Candidatus Microbacterium colombiense]|nr:MAG: low molecular weight phosphatase family protein [Microbacterium sp.]
MSFPFSDAPPGGRSRRELREQNRPQKDKPVPLADLLGEPSTAGSNTGAPTILTVCTGNICRSPQAEVLLRRRLEGVGVRVHSAGTHALVGHGMTDQAQQIAVRSGARVDAAAAHAARYLVEPLLIESDLILTMAGEHRSHVVKMMPSRLRQTFTVREFARLAATVTDEAIRTAADTAGDAPPARLRAAIRMLSGQRGLSLSTEEDDDVIDPYRRSWETYEMSAAQLLPAIDEVERVVRAALS